MCLSAEIGLAAFFERTIGFGSLFALQTQLQCLLFSANSFSDGAGMFSATFISTAVFLIISGSPVDGIIYISLLLAAVAQPHTLQGGSVSACCLAATFYFLFRTYQGVEPVGDVFRGFFFYGLATLAVPPLLLLLPVLLLMQTGFHHLSPRTLCAALIGALLPYWFLGGYAWTIGEGDLLLRQLAAVVRFSPTDYGTLTPPAIATLALTLLLTLWSIIHYARNSFLDKIRTRTCIYYILSTEALLWVLLAFQPVLYPSLAAPLTACASLLAGHYFAVTRDRRSGIGLLVTLALIAALYLLDVWTQLYSSF